MGLLEMFPDAIEMKDAAAYVGKSLDSFNVHFHKDWGIPHMRVAGRVLFFKSDLDRWMAARVAVGAWKPRDAA